MASTQHAGQHSRYPLNNYSSGDLRLPSLKDLNFYRPPPGNPPESIPAPSGAPNDFVSNIPDHISRHTQWNRSAQPTGMQGANAMPPHPQHSQPQPQPQPQQHSPPLSAGHDMSEQSVQYSKHDGVYARPGIPLSAQVTPVPGSVNVGPAMRGEDASPLSPIQPRRPRLSSANINATRDGRPSHNSYAAPYNTYPSNQPPPNSPYHQIANQSHTPHSVATPSQEQLNHNIPVSNHHSYNGYQQHYLQSRPPVHPHQHAPQLPHPQQQLSHQPQQPTSSSSHHILHSHHSQQQQQQQHQQQHQQHQQQHQQHQQQHQQHHPQQHHHQHQHPQHHSQHHHQHPQQQTTATHPQSQTSVHPSALLQHSNQHSHTHHQPSHSQPALHQPQQQSLANHPPHGNPYPSPNHPPQSSWAQQNHPQQTHSLVVPSHTQQTPQSNLPSVHSQPLHASHHSAHLQSNSAPAPTPQSMLQQAHPHPHPQQQQHTLPPPQQPQIPPQTPQSQHHPPHQSQAPTPVPHHVQHHPPPQSQHLQSHPSLPPPQTQPHPPPPLAQQLSFARIAPVLPNVDSRNSHYPPAPPPAPSSEAEHSEHNEPVNEIIKYCNALYLFANHYSTVPQSMSHNQPSPSELQEMSQKAQEIVLLLEDFERTHLSENECTNIADPLHGSSEDHRAPKRPWEDMGQEDFPNSDQAGDFPPGDQAQTTAEQDMQIIRSKRATSTIGIQNPTGQAKSKYRKRSRATPPGKCHSCNIRETPEWRRGPDGARTLCNACGLHYAKLMRKREKADPTGPRIDLETLRASARAAESSDRTRSKHKNVVIEPSSPADTKPDTQQHHQGSFQLINVMVQDPNPVSSEPNRTISLPQPVQAPPPPVKAVSSGSLPVPPWATSAPQSHPPPPSVSISAHGRVYAQEHFQHQSFLRSSQHVSAPQASSR